VDIVFAISEYTKNDLNAYTGGHCKGKVVVTPLAANRKKFNTTANCNPKGLNIRLGLDPSNHLILSAGTLEIRKNLDVCIRSFGFLREGLGLVIKLVITGMKGWKGHKITSAIRSLSPQSRKSIIFTVFVSDQELLWLYRNTRCFVYMSEHEGFGLPPLEAMACGLPVACSNTTSISEVIGNGGIPIDLQDFKPVAKAPSILFVDKNTHRQLKSEPKKEPGYLAGKRQLTKWSIHFTLHQLTGTMAK
jgi:glycosyltransferase involved in cell wall biosynthesis